MRVILLMLCGLVAYGQQTKVVFNPLTGQFNSSFKPTITGDHTTLPCTPGVTAQLYDSGYYDCTAPDTWTARSTASGTVTSVSGTTNQISVATGTTTPVISIVSSAILPGAPTITGTNITGLPVSTGISGLGTGVATALAVNVGSAGAPVLFNGAGGTPSSLTCTNCTGFPATVVQTNQVNTFGNFLQTFGAAGLTSPLATLTGTLTAVDAVYTGQVGLKAGTVGSPSIYLSTDSTTGWWRNSSQQWTWGTGGAFNWVSLLANTVRFPNNLVLCWNNTGSDSTATACNTGLSEDSAGVIDFGTGAQGSTAGSWKATNGTLSGTLTYGGVTLSNAVTGTGNMVLSAGPTFTGTLNAAAVAATSLVSTNQVTAGVNSYINFLGRSAITSPSDGVLYLQNNASNDFARLQFGGTTSSFPALKRSSTTLAIRLADDSADAPMTASLGTFSATVQTGLYTVATLPTCNGAAEGKRAGATDLLAPTFLTAAVGGSTTHGSVYCNGTAWVTD